MELLAQRNILRLELLMPEQARDAHFQLLDLHSPFGNVIVSPEFQTENPIGLSTFRGQEDYWDGRQ